MLRVQRYFRNTLPQINAVVEKTAMRRVEYENVICYGYARAKCDLHM